MISEVWRFILDLGGVRGWRMMMYGVLGRVGKGGF